ncbi:hypothetical protein DFH09DRAFT_1376044 [Mycena vulgaris]|nr:hypothetical protein DFH09DRAFT_1376044 [Mycena vulgaris]
MSGCVGSVDASTASLCRPPPRISGIVYRADWTVCAGPLDRRYCIPSVYIFKRALTVSFSRRTSRPRCWIEKIEGWHRGLARCEDTPGAVLYRRRVRPRPPHPRSSCSRHASPPPAADAAVGAHPYIRLPYSPIFPFSSTSSFLRALSLLLLPASPSPRISVPTVVATSPYSFPRLRLLRPPRPHPLPLSRYTLLPPVRPRTSSFAFFPHPAATRTLHPYSADDDVHPLPILVLFIPFLHAPPFPILFPLLLSPSLVTSSMHPSPGVWVVAGLTPALIHLFLTAIYSSLLDPFPSSVSSTSLLPYAPRLPFRRRSHPYPPSLPLKSGRP